MNIRLIKKLKKKFNIITCKAETVYDFNGDTVIKQGDPIYRLVRKGKKVNYAWSQDLKTLILAVCYLVHYRQPLSKSFEYSTAEKIVEWGRNKRKRIKLNALRDRYIKKAEKVWP